MSFYFITSAGQLEIPFPQGALSSTQPRDRLRASVYWSINKNEGCEITCEDHTLAEEVVSMLRGEHGDLDIVIRALHHLGSREWPIDMHRDMSRYWTPEPITLVCSDGPVEYCSLPSLRRRFHLIDDYFTEYPDEKSITLTCTKAELEKCLGEPLYCNLRTSYAALMYLNPKNNIYPFYCDLEEVTIDIIETLVAKLTKEERDALVAYAACRKKALPSNEGVYILGALDRVTGTRSVMKAIYAERYPSFLFYHLRELTSSTDRQYMLGLLLSGFEPEEERIIDETLIRQAVRKEVLFQLNFEVTLDVALSLAAMTGLKLNEEQHTPRLPYGVVPASTDEERMLLAREVVVYQYMSRYDKNNPLVQQLTSIAWPESKRR